MTIVNGIAFFYSSSVYSLLVYKHSRFFKIKFYNYYVQASHQERDRVERVRKQEPGPGLKPWPVIWESSALTTAPSAGPNIIDFCVLIST